MKIGTFEEDTAGYAGHIHALGIRSDRVIFRMVAAKKQPKEPDYTVAIESIDTPVDVGAAWKKTTHEGKPYLSVRLDGPTLPAAINCALMRSPSGSLDLVWNRDSRKEQSASI
jgi:uncharacterized protein (DUF736 family)